MSDPGAKDAVTGAEVRVLLLLTLTAGVYDAVTFVGLDQVFVALITGNLLLIGFALSDPGLTLGGPVVAIAGFFVAAALTGRLDLSAHNREQLLSRTVAAEGLLLVPAAIMAIGYDGQDLRRLAILAVLGAAMGVRNETMREVAVPQLRTTLQTLALSSVATELARSRSLDTAGRERLGGVLLQFAGAAIGGLLVYKTEIVWPLLLLLAINAGTFVVLLRRQRSSVSPPGSAPSG